MIDPIKVQNCLQPVSYSDYGLMVKFLGPREQAATLAHLFPTLMDTTTRHFA
jgi:hypothetical protein